MQQFQKQEPLNPWLVSYILQQRFLYSRYEIDRYLLAAGYGSTELEAAWQAVTASASSPVPPFITPIQHRTQLTKKLFGLASLSSGVALVSLFLPCYDWGGTFYNGFGFALGQALSLHPNQGVFASDGGTPAIIWLFLALLFSLSLNLLSFSSVSKNRRLDGFRLVVLHGWALSFIFMGYYDSFWNFDGRLVNFPIQSHHLIYGSNLLTFSLITMIGLTFAAIRAGVRLPKY